MNIKAGPSEAGLFRDLFPGLVTPLVSDNGFPPD